MPKLTQQAAFARIKALGFIIRKTEYGEYRLANPALSHLTGERESAAYYCSDLQEAVEQAEFMAEQVQAKQAEQAEQVQAEPMGDLIAASRAALFAIESAIMLQGIAALAPYAADLKRALQQAQQVQA